MQPLDLLLWFLATFYWSHAVTKTSGPFKLFSRARERWPDSGLISCIVCIAPYIATLLLIIQPISPIIILISAAAGQTVLLYRFSGGNHTTP